MNPCEFAVDFVRSLRDHPDIVQMPSSRQVLSIPRLILSRYYRKGKITPNDYIEISRVTSFPDNQKLAKDIAFKLLFPNYNQDAISNLFGDAGSLEGERDLDFMNEQEKSELDQMQDMIDEIEMSKNVDTDAIEELERFMDELNQKRNEEPYKSALQFFNDDSELFKEQISSLERLMEEARERMMEKINSLSPQDLQAGANLNMDDQVQQKSVREWEKLTSEALNGQDISNELNDLLNDGNFEDLIQSLKYLKETGALPQDQMKDYMNDLKKRIENLLYFILCF